MFRFRRCRGFSTIETSAVIGAVSLLSATAAPHLQDYLDTAHVTKAMGDAKVIAISIVRLTTHVGHVGGYQRVRPDLLVSGGNVPASTEPATAKWTRPLDGRETQALESHLVDNTAGYNDEPAEPMHWRGPYVEGLGADPWGFRYAVNVGELTRGRANTVVVISPGPNGSIETPYETRALPTGGDDVIGLIGRGQ